METPRSSFPARSDKAPAPCESGDRITERLNEVYGEDAPSSALDETLATFQTLSLPTDEEW